MSIKHQRSLFASRKSSLFKTRREKPRLRSEKMLEYTEDWSDTIMMARLDAIHFSWLGQELFRLLLGPPGLKW